MTNGTVVDNTSGSLVTVARMMDRAFHAHTVLDSFMMNLFVVDVATAVVVVHRNLMDRFTNLMVSVRVVHTDRTVLNRSRSVNLVSNR